MPGTLLKSSTTRTQALVDGCGRRIDHLRMSLTDRCNLACTYCSTGEARRHAFIDFNLAVAIVRWLSSRHGVDHVRLTGGEPLLYPRLPELVASLSLLGTLSEITLTTNGQGLAHQATRLRQAGLTRINVSLDTLNARTFAGLTRGGSITHTVRGIEAAIEAGLVPLRLNVVVQRGTNDTELCDVAEWGLARGCTVRFLELMPIGPAVDTLPARFVAASEIVERLSRRFTLRQIPAPDGQPATDYAAVPIDSAGSSGAIGVIASTTRPFCDRCRRLRITSRGDILSCLFDTGGSSLADAWNGAILDEDAADKILQASVMAKPQGGGRSQSMSMMGIGG